MHIYNAEDVRASREELGTDMFTAKKIAWQEGKM
jgi:hypothetical protein